MEWIMKAVAHHLWDQPKGMSLLELLVVIGIMGLLVAVTLPSLSGTQNSLKIHNATSAVTDQLRLARQLAVARSKPITVVVFQTQPAEGMRWAGIQLAGENVMNLYSDDDEASVGLVVAGRPVVLPAPMQFHGNAANSSLLSLPNNPRLVGLSPSVYSAKAFTFFPDGSTSLDPTRVWTLTIAAESEEGKSVPDNFASIIVDPVSGRFRTYQP
jgi:uncharacterized protein (TIGR02596 family)